MKIKPEAGALPLPEEVYCRDYAQARVLGRVRLGLHALYYPHLAWTGALPLEQVERVYLRIEDIPVGMGCRRVPMGQHYLMAVLRDGGSRKAAVNSRGEGDWALERVHALRPEVKTGYAPPASEEGTP